MFNHLEKQSKLDACLDFNISRVNSYVINNSLIIHTIAYDERIPGYRILGTGKVDNYVYFDCLFFKSYKNAKCTAYIQKINSKMKDGFVIYVIMKDISFIPKYVMLNEYCLPLPQPVSIKKPLYDYTLCVIPDTTEKEENYKREWINHNRRIGIEKIVIYNYQNSVFINTNDSLLDIIDVQEGSSTDMIMNDCLYRYRAMSKSILFMKMKEVIILLKTNMEMKLSNFIKQKDRESYDMMYLCKCRTVNNTKNVDFDKISKLKLKCENKYSHSFLIVNNPLKFNYITQKGYFGDYWYYSKTKVKKNIIVLETN